MGLLDWTILAVTSGVTTHQPSYDGTYIWFATQDAGGNRRLYRLRTSDQQLIRPDGTVGTPADAYVALPVWPLYCPVASNGTYVFVPNTTNGNFFGVYRCSDMSLVGHYSAIVGSGTGRAGDVQSLYCDGTDVYFGGSNSSTGRKSLFKWASGATSLVQVWTHPSQSGSFAHTSSDGTDIWLSGYDTVGPMKVSKAGTLLASAAVTTGVILGEGAYSSTLDSMFFAGSLIEYIQVRNSDGAYLTRAQGVDTFANAKVVGGSTDSAISGPSGGTAVAGGHLYVGGTLGKLQRRLIVSGMNGAGYWHQSNPLIPSGVGSMIVVGTTLYAALGFVSAAAATGGIMWAEYDVLPVVPKLTNVDPGTGPKIGLIFDNPVTADPPTIGPPTAQIVVSGVTQVDATHIDLNLTIVPPAPDAPIGSAVVDSGPEAPSGGAVNSDAIPASPVAGAWRDL